MKEQIIQIPDTLEVKEIKDGKIILVEKKKKLTYKDVAKKLFRDTEIHYYITTDGETDTTDNNIITRYCKNNATSRKQLKKLLAINMLMNVAKYLNDGWRPNWNDSYEYKYYIYCDRKGTLRICSSASSRSTNIYFKSDKFAEQAIEILGEETVKLALCTDY